MSTPGAVAGPSADAGGPTDEELLATFLAARDTAARDRGFAAIVDRFEPRVYGVCYRYFRDHGDAQDAAQDTFLTLLRKAEQFRGDSKLSTWIYRIATNACHDLARKRARRPQTPVADVAATMAAAGHSEAAAEDLLGGRELAREIQRALLELDELSRTLIILCSIEGQSYAEASAAMDLPVGTIKSRVFRARARLAELLAPVLATDGENADLDVDTSSGEVPGSASAHVRERGPRGPPV